MVILVSQSNISFLHVWSFPNTERDLAKSDLKTEVVWRRCVVRYTGSNNASIVTCLEYSGYIHKKFLLGIYLLP